MLTFELRRAAVRVHGIRQDAPPRMLSVEYELAVDTDESDSRLDLLHRNWNDPSRRPNSPLRRPGGARLGAGLGQDLR